MVLRTNTTIKEELEFIMLIRRGISSRKRKEILERNRKKYRHTQVATLEYRTLDDIRKMVMDVLNNFYDPLILGDSYEFVKFLYHDERNLDGQNGRCVEIRYRHPSEKFLDVCIARAFYPHDISGNLREGKLKILVYDNSLRKRSI